MNSSKTVDVSIPHQLGRATAKARLQQGAERLRAQFGGQAANVEETWTGDRCAFKFTAMGQSITGRLDYLAADPAQKQRIAELQAELARLMRETGIERDQMPLDEGVKQTLPDQKIR